VARAVHHLSALMLLLSGDLADLLRIHHRVWQLGVADKVLAVQEVVVAVAVVVATRCRCAWLIVLVVVAAAVEEVQPRMLGLTVQLAVYLAAAEGVELMLLHQ